MNRRAFLRGLSVASATGLLMPEAIERLLFEARQPHSVVMPKGDLIWLDELDDVIYNISPMETPFMANLGNARIGRLHEWTEDVLEHKGPNVERTNYKLVQQPVQIMTHWID